MANLHLLANASVQLGAQYNHADDDEVEEKTALTKSVSAPLLRQKPMGQGLGVNMGQNAAAGRPTEDGTPAMGSGTKQGGSVWRPF